jgi:gas vesicle protein
MPKTLLLLLTVSIAGGCASTTHGEKMVQSFTKTRQMLADSQNQVDMTLVTLHSLRTAPPEYVKDVFGRYKKSVDQLEEEGKKAEWRAQTMKEEGDTYIKTWQEEMKDIKDPAIKASLESRRDAVRTNFKLVRMYAEDARKAYGPFLQGSKELVQALSIDLSPAGLTSLAPAIDRVTANGQALKQRIAAIQNSLDNIAQGKSAIGL